MGDKYSAAESTLGYLYQCRYALLRALQASKVSPNLSISIEKFDDVAFDLSGAPTELIQSKHHCTPGKLSDNSSDVWKTLNIWIDRFLADQHTAMSIKFILLTTSTAAEHSAMSLLREFDDSRDEGAAINKLVQSAGSSKNAATEASRHKFIALSDAQRKALVSNIWVFDRAPNIIDVRSEIVALLHYAAIGKADTLTSYLEGWWFNRVVLALSGDEISSISLASLEMKVHELSEGFKLGNLPVDVAIDQITTPPTFGDDRIFIRQLGFVEVSPATRDAAIRDYYKAFSQRSRWARENLLLDGETEKYDRSLEEAWGHKFAAMCEDCEGLTDQERTKLGRDLYRWASMYCRPLRGREEQWLSNGSFQMLSDTKKVGWHPDYVSKIGSDSADA